MKQRSTELSGSVNFNIITKKIDLSKIAKNNTIQFKPI